MGQRHVRIPSFPLAIGLAEVNLQGDQRGGRRQVLRGPDHPRGEHHTVTAVERLSITGAGALFKRVERSHHEHVPVPAEPGEDHRTGGAGVEVCATKRCRCDQVRGIQH